MKRTVAAIVAGLLGASPTGAQVPEESAEEKKQREEFCRKALCRQPTTIRVALPDNGVFEVLLPVAYPIVFEDGTAIVFSGEEVHVAFEVDGATLRNPRAVKNAADAKHTLSFRFSQEPASGKSSLLVSTTIEQPVKYDLSMQLTSDARKTSACPVSARLGVMETWPHPILALTAKNFRILPPGSRLVCE